MKQSEIAQLRAEQLQAQHEAKAGQSSLAAANAARDTLAAEHQAAIDRLLLQNGRRHEDTLALLRCFLPSFLLPFSIKIFS
jgi:DNA-binding TFAR19-related protein (PDSD5 family)